MEPMEVDDKDIIFNLAGECEGLFSKIHTHPPASWINVSNLLEEYQHRFAAWTAYLGVFAKESICLDRRLIRHPEVQDQVVRLLDILQFNLEQVSLFVGSLAGGRTAFSGQAEDGQTDSPLAPELRVALEAIGGAIDRLNRVGIAIRRSSTRGSTFTLPDNSPGTSDGFGQTMLGCIQALYPDARIELQKYLSQCMATRHHTIKSKQSRNEELQTRRTKPAPSLDPIPEGEGSNMDHQPSQPVIATTTFQGETHIHSLRTSFGRQRTHRPQSEPSSINNSVFQHQMNTGSRRKGTSSIQVKQVRYPKAPSSGSNPNFIRCEWCFESINKRDTEGSQWWSHVDKDFNPYICLSDNSCSHPTRHFSNFKDWDRHMRSMHGETWYRDAYPPSAWVCAVCPRGSTEFSTPEQLDDHLREAHRFTDIQREAIVGQSRTYVQRGPETCPLCCFSVKEDEVAAGDRSTRVRETEHAEPGKRHQPSPGPQSSSKRARTEIGAHNPLPNSSAEDTPPDQESNIAPAEPDQACIELMSRHVAAHLQALMLLVIRFIDSQKDGDETERYGGSTADSGNDLTRKALSWDSSFSSQDTSEAEDVEFIPAQDNPSEIIPGLASNASYDIPHSTGVPVSISPKPIDNNSPLLSDTDNFTSKVLSWDCSLPNEYIPEVDNIKVTRKRAPNVPLRTRLFKAMIHVNDTDRGIREQLFLPEGQLTAILSKKAVQKELKKYSVKSSGDDAALVEFILESAPKTFSALVYGGGGVFIRPLYHAKLDDGQLPLNEKQLRKPIKKGLRKAKSDVVDDSYIDAVVHNFVDHNQWLFTSPVFDGKTFKYTLDAKTSLPFLPVDSTEATSARGGFGTVQERILHRSHIVLDSPDILYREVGGERHPRIAEKELVKPGEWNPERHTKEAEKEARNLQSMMAIGHPHLIKAIAYCTQGPRHVFLFPFTEDGNLNQYWLRANPDLTVSSHQIKWTLTQLAGLANGIHNLHDTNCRHGDLKPANILCFHRDKDAQHSVYTKHLVIADVGLAKSHKEITALREGKTTTLARTIMYSPPELEFDPDTPRSRLFDIWSLGCIFLECVVWLVFGTDGLGRFHDHMGGLGQRGPFYDVNPKATNRDGPEDIFRVHPAVKRWVKDIKDRPCCAEGTAVRKFVDIVANRMLVIATSNFSGADLENLGRKASRTLIMSREPSTPQLLVSSSTSVEPAEATANFRANASEVNAAISNILKEVRLGKLELTANSKDDGPATQL